MASAKRLHLHPHLHLQRLHALLLDPGQSPCRVAELMAAAGLIASGLTSADYGRWCGESPRTTGQKRLDGR